MDQEPAKPDGSDTLDLSGRCVGSSFILIRPIGQGATGVVWRGVDRSSGEPVAVKLLHESLLRQPKLVTRFVQERTILLMLRHRNVVRVRDLFSVGESLGLVMDLVPGGSLRDHLREQGPLPASEAARLAAQVAAALTEAHELGIVHRDLKPDNILLQPENGRLDTRLTDFGIARVLNTPALTTPHAVVGTPHYMSPEAFHGATASPAADVYALGVLLYELVTGRPPYDSDSIPDLMRRHLEGNPHRPHGIPDQLWNVIVSCLIQKPRRRPTAAELMAELSDVSHATADHPALPPPSPPTAPALSLPTPEPVPPKPEPLSVPAPPKPDPPVPEPSTPEPLTPEPLTPEPLTPEPLTPEPSMPEPSMPEPSMPELPSVPEPGPAEPGPSEPGPAEPGPAEPDTAEPESVSAANPRSPGKHNQVPSWRWARPGAWAALIGGAMVASAVATTAWHLGGADNDPGDIVVAEPARTLPASQPPAPHPSASPTSPAPAPKPAAAVGDQHRAAVKAEPAKRTASVRKTAAPRHSSKPPAVPEKAYGPLVCKGYVSFNFTSSLFAQPCHNEGTKVQIRALLTGAAGGSATVSVALQDASTGRNVAGPHTCSGQAFSEGIKQQQCGPFTANPHHGRHYVVVMSWSYNRDGRPTTGTAHGDEFSW